MPHVLRGSPVQAVVPLEVATAVGGLKELTPSGTSVLLEGTLTETPPGTKQVLSFGAHSLPRGGELYVRCTVGFSWRLLP